MFAGTLDFHLILLSLFAVRCGNSFIQCILIFDAAAAAAHRRPDHTSSHRTWASNCHKLTSNCVRHEFYRNGISGEDWSRSIAAAAHDNIANAQRTRCLPSQVMTFCDCNNSAHFRWSMLYGVVTMSYLAYKVKVSFAKYKPNQRRHSFFFAVHLRAETPFQYANTTWKTNCENVIRCSFDRLATSSESVQCMSGRSIWLYDCLMKDQKTFAKRFRIRQFDVKCQ